LSESGYPPIKGLTGVSPTFANLPLTTEIPHFLTQSLEIGEIAMIRCFRDWIRQQMKN